jgi:hypothetical protein
VTEVLRGGHISAPAFDLGAGGIIVVLDLVVVGLDIGLSALDPAMPHELLDGRHRHICIDQVIGEGVPEPVGSDRNGAFLAIAHEPQVDGMRGEFLELIGEKDEVARGGGPNVKIVAQSLL